MTPLNHRSRSSIDADRPPEASRLRLPIAIAAALATIVAVFGVITTATSAASSTCSVDYRVVNEWPGGFQGAITITNTGPAIDGWNLTFDFPDGQSVNHGWVGRFSQSGSTVTVSNAAWNGSLASGATATPGFIGVQNGANGVPGSFSLNGQVCDSDGGPTTTAPNTTTTVGGPSTTVVDPTTTVVGPTTTVANTTTTAGNTTTTAGDTTTTMAPTTTVVGPTTTIGNPGGRVDNPFVGARGYVNPEWQALVNETAAEVGGSLGQDMRAVGRYPTAVWLDRIGAIDPPGERLGLREHLDNAVAQAAGQPLTISVVIYDLPNRDCAALASNGELRMDDNGIERYRTEYIDEIVSIMGDPAYAGLRIVNIIEPDSLPNLVTNLDKPDCAQAAQAGGYADGIAYALGRLRTLPNTYAYIDIGHSGWLGWDSNFGPAVNLIADTVKKPEAGVDTVDGFISNTSGYTPTEEKFLPDDTLTLGGGLPIRSSDFYEWNPYFDETDFVLAIRQAFVAAGLPNDIGMLIDTSRNGWGGSERPGGVSTSSNINTYVDESRVDRRPHRGGWCNQVGAGIGERPTAAPEPGIDAYVWVKPPGESDGISQAGVVDPDDPAKRFDGMCDPSAQSTYNSNYSTNALPGAPHAGRWFASQFEMLVRNAYPAL